MTIIPEIKLRFHNETFVTLDYKVHHPILSDDGETCITPARGDNYIRNFVILLHHVNNLEHPHRFKCKFTLVVGG